MKKRLLRFANVLLLPLLFLLLMAMSIDGRAQTVTVTTDKDDYSPGETVIITGTGWQPGETVNIVITHQIFTTHPLEYLTEVADVNGEFVNSDYYIDFTDLGESFLLDAFGTSSGFMATTTFTDGTLAIKTDLLNKAVYCDGQEMTIYFSTTGTTAGFNSTNFSAQRSNPGGNWGGSSVILTTTQPAEILSTDGTTTYWKMTVIAAYLNSGSGNHYAIRVNYDPTPLNNYPEVAGSTLENVRNAPVQVYGSVTAFSLSSSGSACSTSGMTITVSNSQFGVSYQLYRDNVALGSPIVASCTLNTCPISFTNIKIAGTYTVVGSVNGGCVTSMSNSIIVTTSAATAPTASNQSFCSGSPSNPTVADLTPNGTEYKWYDNNFIGLTSTTPLSTGTYYVTYTNASGCESAPTSVFVTVPAIPLFSSTSSVRCQKLETITYTATGATGIIYSLDQASLDAGCVINSSTGAVEYAAAFVGTSIITAKAIGCDGEVFATHTVSTNPNATAGYIYGSTNVCANSNGIKYYILPENPATSYTWTVPTGATIASGQNSTEITVNFGSSVNGNITVTPVGGCVIEGTSSSLAVVTSTGAVIGPVTGNATVCAGAINQVYSISAVTKAKTYTWSVPGDATITSGQGSNSINVTFGSISGLVSVYTDNSCGSAIKSVTVTNAPVITTQPTDQPIIYQTNAVFSVVAEDATAYQWKVSTDGGVSYNTLNGATSSSLTVNNPDLTYDGYRYRGVVSNACFSVTS